MKTPGIESFTRAFGPMLTIAPAHFIILLLLSLPGRLVAVDLELRRVGGYDASGPALGVALSGHHAYVAAGVHGDAGLSVRVQRSANLHDWEDWKALTLGATPSELSDLDAGAHYFYRAVTP